MLQVYTPSVYCRQVTRSVCHGQNFTLGVSNFGSLELSLSIQNVILRMKKPSPGAFSSSPYSDALIMGGGQKSPRGIPDKSLRRKKKRVGWAKAPTLGTKLPTLLSPWGPFWPGLPPAPQGTPTRQQFSTWMPPSLPLPPLKEGGVPESAGNGALIRDGLCQTLHQAAKLHSPHLLGPRDTGLSFLLKTVHTPELQLPLPRTNPSRIPLGAWAQPQPRQTEEKQPKVNVCLT